VQAIREERDATDSERGLREVNSGILMASATRLRDWLDRLDNRNAQGEYYLTDVVAMAAADGIGVAALKTDDPLEAHGINDTAQLAMLERHHQNMNAKTLMKQGVTLRDPARLDVRGEVTAGRDVVIDANVILEGTVTLGNRVSIGPNVVIRDCTLADDVSVLANCVLEGARIGTAARIGPFARLRPQTDIGAGAHIGNFVEVKMSRIGAGSKINHLSYIGDTEVGANVNIGAGTITCNYDGARKHKTVIGDGAFIGSNAQLIAPVTIGAGATIGAGSTITADAPAGELTLSRAEQKTVKGWQRPSKDETD
jgi:bifunctional UDP-N-acetylglucosamine pyrophosphorylase/glucosamine-1-phosphate N-acetyltransferase